MKAPRFDFMSKLAAAAFIQVSGRVAARTISIGPIPWWFLNKPACLM